MKCKNQELATTAFAKDRKLQSKQADSLAELRVKLADHMKLQDKKWKKLQRMREAMHIAQAGGVPKGFEGKITFPSL